MKINKFLKINKIIEKTDFKDTMRSPFVSKRKGLCVFWKENSLEAPRLGVSVAKKNVKKAVERNRIKRVIRETFRNNKSKLSNVDVVALITRAENNKCLASNFEKVIIYLLDDNNSTLKTKN